MASPLIELIVDMELENYFIVLLTFHIIPEIRLQVL